jgi:hypothetical protein
VPRSRGPGGSTVSNGRCCRSAKHPKRCPVAPESFDSDHPIRVLTYGRKPHAYRVFFTIDADGEIVRVLHVRRGARQGPVAEELRGE